MNTCPPIHPAVGDVTLLLFTNDAPHTITTTPVLHGTPIRPTIVGMICVVSTPCRPPT